MFISPTYSRFYLQLLFLQRFCPPSHAIGHNIADTHVRFLRYWGMSELRRQRQLVSRKHQGTSANQPGLLSVLRSLAGPAFVIGGWQLMSTSYVVGVSLVYLGFVICLAEIIWEPLFLRKPYQ